MSLRSSLRLMAILLVAAQEITECRAENSEEEDGFREEFSAVFNICFRNTSIGTTVTECCPGFRALNASSASGLPLCEPICNPECVNGKCIAPDVCHCLDGYRHEIDAPSYICLAECHPKCVNAYCMEVGVCQCKPGYVAAEEPHACRAVAAVLRGGVFAADAVEGDVSVATGAPQCWPPCGPFARCVAPDRCECVEGYGARPGDHRRCVPICSPPCGVGGACIAPGLCACGEDFQRGPNGDCVRKCQRGTTWHRASKSCRANPPSEVSTPHEETWRNRIEATTVLHTTPSFTEMYSSTLSPSTDIPSRNKSFPILSLMPPLLCVPPCLYGHCVATGVCKCALGWTGMSCAEPCPLRPRSTKFDHIACPELENCICSKATADGKFCLQGSEPQCTDYELSSDNAGVKQFPKWFWCLVAFGVMAASVLVFVVLLIIFIKWRSENFSLLQHRMSQGE